MMLPKTSLLLFVGILEESDVFVYIVIIVATKKNLVGPVSG